MGVETMNESPATLRDGEPHPAAENARQWLLEYVRRHDAHELPRLLESFCSVGMSGNRLAELCGETLRRLLNREPVSDRYLLGLIWTIRSMEEQPAPAPDPDCPRCESHLHRGAAVPCSDCTLVGGVAP